MFPVPNGPSINNLELLELCSFKCLLIFFMNSCATQNISEIQEENCYDYKQFEKFHRCAEKLTKDSYQYKFSFDIP